MLFHFLKTITFTRISNSLKLLLSYCLSVLSKRPFHWGMPSFIAIEPVNLCNLKCPECPVGNGTLTRQARFIESDLHHKLVDEIGRYLWTILYYFQGEPFLNKDLFEMIRYAKKKNIFTITSTNGHFLSENNCSELIKSGLDKIIISMDGIGSEVYNVYRKNGNYQKVINGIETLVSARLKFKSKTPRIVLQFLVLKSNQHQLDDVKKLGDFLKVDKVVFKTAQLYDFQNGHPLIPDIPRYSRYMRDKSGHYRIKSDLKNRCWRMWTNPVLTSSGEIAVCCFDKNAEFSPGSFQNQSFRQIWHSPEYLGFRNILFQNRKSIEMCNNCTEGLKKVIF
jgi:MoaA/NifB/PqqE/SkfB family radical SAM enzyme